MLYQPIIMKMKIIKIMRMKIIIIKMIIIMMVIIIILKIIKSIERVKLKSIKKVKVYFINPNIKKRVLKILKNNQLKFCLKIVHLI